MRFTWTSMCATGTGVGTPQQAVELDGEGYFRTAPSVTAELCEVVAGRKPGRERAEERIIAMNLGVAMADVAVAQRLYTLALARNLGTVLPL